MDELGDIHPHGVFLRAEALAYGYSDRDLVAALRHKSLAKVRHGAYVSAKQWEASNAEQRFRLRGDAVLLRHGPKVALSHTSGAAHLGLRLWNVDMRQVHVTRLDGGPSRVHGDVVYHAGAWRPEDIYETEHGLTLSPVRSALETASLHPVEQGVVVLDSLLDLGLATPDDVHATHRAIRRWPHSARLEMSVRLAQPGAESVGESRMRILCFFEHLPKPVLQFEVYDEAGRLLGTTDFAWPDHQLLGEFDGKIKYGRLLRPGELPGDAVFREKVREDLLREATGWALIRFIWANLATRRETGNRLRRALGSRTPSF